MKIEEQVLSVEQIKHLKDNGFIFKDYSLCWVLSNSGKYFVAPVNLVQHNDYIPTLTLHEIWNLFPSKVTYNNIEYELTIGNIDKMFNICYFNHKFHTLEDSFFTDDNELNTFYKMLCYLIEEGHLKK